MGWKKYQERGHIFIHSRALRRGCPLTRGILWATLVGGALHLDVVVKPWQIGRSCLRRPDERFSLYLVTRDGTRLP